MRLSYERFMKVLLRKSLLYSMNIHACYYSEINHNVTVVNCVLYQFPRYLVKPEIEAMKCLDDYPLRLTSI